MAIPLFVNQYYPQYLQNSGYAAIGLIVFLVVGLYLNAIIQGPRYPHIEHSVFDSNTGIAYRILDFFIDFFEPSEKIPDIYPMMKKDSTGKYVPVYYGGRWWYPYLVKTHWPIDFGDFKDITLHIFCLPHPWDDFMKFGRRPEGAYLTGEQIDHSTSSHVDSILAPFTADYIGLKIPIYLSVFSRNSVLKITRSWKDGMNELARYVRVMDPLINEVQARIFPNKELEEVAREVFPELLAQYARERKKSGTSK